MTRKIVHVLAKEEYELTKTATGNYEIIINGIHMFYTAEQIMNYLMKDIWRFVD